MADGPDPRTEHSAPISTPTPDDVRAKAEEHGAVRGRGGMAGRRKPLFGAAAATVGLLVWRRSRAKSRRKDSHN
ncbi:hypothetical protein [Yinghuangia soli]|uniref:Uncharacterized protein n=1 Tax=Yinghuangia soli TaxID=2908204 RepID=A0AA41Q0Y7_9ACTN|nr:hypothetical protein [Yinghuangia soli]MCF2528771.1 hypothetical protein [Yinghuangia soli]